MKLKGKCVEEVFHAEPSYYSWMQQGDFPLYTKRCLEKIWVRWNGKREQLKVETKTTVYKSQVQNRPHNQQREKKEEAKPINNAMLEQLKLKFGK